jgi:hypothetical protein
VAKARVGDAGAREFESRQVVAIVLDGGGIEIDAIDPALAELIRPLLDGQDVCPPGSPAGT